MNKIKSTKGITLISLVVTIIILLILSGVAIATLMGNNSLINKANNAKIETEITSIKEEIQTEILSEQAGNQGSISDSSLKTILEKYGTLSEEEKLIDKTLTTTKGNHEIKVADIFNGTTVKDAPLKPYVLEETMGGANSPNISGFNVENTYYVTWKTTAPYQINETNTINNAPPSGWSNYNGKEWANIKTTGGGNDCYWVWIPRYAYKVPTRGNTAQTIEIAFLRDTGSTIDDVIDETKKTEIETAGGFKTTATPGNWVIHPAFTNAGNGEFGELTGIWVAKYEASSSNVSTINLENGILTGDTSSLVGTGGGIYTSLQVRVKPNVTSWRGINVNGIFEVCQNLTKTVTINGVPIKNSLADTTNLDSHLMKNTEWGAVAYLSMSVYGKNGKVWNNPYYNGTINYSPITGLAGKTETQTNNGTTTDLYKYNTTEGVNASTTGNVYGIYDMAGGAWEYTAGCLSEITANTNYTTLASADPKYKDVYLGTSEDRNTNYDVNSRKYGDAVYETSNFGDHITGSWNASYSYFPVSSYPVFARGGRAVDGEYACVFAFSSDIGQPNTSSSFRPVVLSFKP